MQQKVRVGITIGDINGIGPEVIIKTLYNSSVQELCIPVIYGSSKVVSYHKNVVKLDDFVFSSIQSAERLNYRKVNVLNCWEDTVNITLGKATSEGGQYAYIALDRAVRDLKEGLIDVLVTGPVNKHAMQMVNFPAIGHTEYLEKELGGKALMLMVSEDLRIAVATGHIPLREVCDNITKENVKNALTLFIDTLRVDFGIDKPTVAVLGLNPHASDEGLMGSEEEEVLSPSIIELKKEGHLVMGPYSADGFFGSNLYRKFDGILAMYHDQGLIPFKALSFGQGVNFTAGLPYIRTSPDHGTAYDLAGTNAANEQSFRRALYLAIDMYKARDQHGELEKNSIKKGRKPSKDTAEINGKRESIPSKHAADTESKKETTSAENSEDEGKINELNQSTGDVEPIISEEPSEAASNVQQTATDVSDQPVDIVEPLINKEPDLPKNPEGDDIKKEPKSP